MKPSPSSESESLGPITKYTLIGVACGLLSGVVWAGVSDAVPLIQGVYGGFTGGLIGGLAWGVIWSKRRGS